MGSYFTRGTKRFVYAVQGVAFLVRTQANARLHLLAAGLVCAAGAYLA
jgi:diacylglycerol kinase